MYKINLSLLALALLVSSAGCKHEELPGQDVSVAPMRDAGPEGEELGVEDSGHGEPDLCAATEEQCNGEDDDCDGLTDESFILSRDPHNCGTCGHRCVYQNAAGRCVDGRCQMGPCYPGYVDQDGDPSNGCELRCVPSNGGLEICDGEDNDCNGRVDDGFDLDSDPSNCGDCGHHCVMRHAVPGCEQGECVIRECEPGWYDENQDPADGCEANCHETNGGVEICDGKDNDCDGLIDEDFDLQTDLENCGECGVRCSFDHGTARCLLGDCVLDGCDEGWSDANHDPSDGCETECVVSNGGVEICDGEDNDCNGRVDDGFDLDTDPDNCGQCGRECRFANGIPGCDGGDCVLVECEEGFVDADHDPANGCETPCVPDEDPFEFCDGRDNDCNGQVDEIWDLMTDVFNCGACGRVCAFANATPGCVDGQCVIEECEPGFADFDHLAANGCEAVCERSNDGVEICDGRDNDCNGQVDDGFDLLGDPDNCGHCGTRCPDVLHGTRGCIGGTCGILECDEGWHDANRDAADGCEYRCDVTNDGEEICDDVDNDCDGVTDEGFDKLHGLEHCGGCFQACEPEHAVAVCDMGVCRVAGCDEGWHDANHDVSDGCEYECEVTNQGLEICDGRDNDCNGRVDDGFDLQTDPFNCGDCGHSCWVPNREVSCVAGRCQVGGCLEGWVDANHDPADGCEYECAVTNQGLEACDGLDNDCDREVDEGFELATDLDNCGQCGRRCDYAHAGATCEDGVCHMGACEPGWWDVDRNPTTGCEYECAVTNQGQEICDGLDNDCNGQVDDGFDLNNDPQNCGACGHQCELPGAVPYCNHGECAILSCEEGHRDVNRSPEDGCECAITNGGVEICDGLDNDCDGEVDNHLGNPPVVCLRLGVCMGVEPRCDGEAGWVCPYPDTYQRDEDLCDGVDNDCDGAVDEGYPDKGTPCGAGVGVCRGEGEMVCNDTHDGLVCSDHEHPERRTEEICNGLDDDCDGETDEDSDVLVQVGDLLIYKYEAARADATPQEQGTSFDRACSTPNRMPWTNVDWETAREVCARAGGKYLCEAEDWVGICQAGQGWAYPYGDEYDMGRCNGYDNGVGHPVPTGSMEGCATPGGVMDLSGNVWEWVDSGPGMAQFFFGGSFGNIGEGLRCDFNVAADPGTARDNIGFRCCTDVQCMARAEPCPEGSYCKQGVCYPL